MTQKRDSAPHPSEAEFTCLREENEKLRENERLRAENTNFINAYTDEHDRRLAAEEENERLRTESDNNIEAFNRVAEENERLRGELEVYRKQLNPMEVARLRRIEEAARLAAFHMGDMARYNDTFVLAELRSALADQPTEEKA